MDITAPVKPPEHRRRRRRGGFFLRFLGFMFAAGMIVFIAVAGAAAFVLWKVSSELPDYEVLAKYEPPVMTRIHANDGALIAEFSRERRIYVPITAIPDCIIKAFISAEDKNFYQHGGLDIQGIIRAVVTNMSNMQSGRRAVGASTITQQVAKNFLLSSDQTVERKLKEAILAIRIERAFTKEQILELYLNEIYLGVGAYGVAAAAQSYWDKALNELTLADCAYLATLPKAPSNYDPFKYPDRAVARRNWVIDRIVENGFATKDEGETAKAQPLGVIKRSHRTQDLCLRIFRRGGAPRDSRPLRRGQALRRRPLGAHDARPAAAAHRPQGAGRWLCRLRSQRGGWRGPVKQIELKGDWGKTLAAMPVWTDIDPWRLAVVLEVSKDKAMVGLRPGRTSAGQLVKERETGVIPFEEVKWARPKLARGLGGTPGSVNAVLKPGDVIYVSPREPKPAEDGTPTRRRTRAQGTMVASAGSRGQGRARRHGSPYRPRARHRRRLQLRRRASSTARPRRAVSRAPRSSL